MTFRFVLSQFFFVCLPLSSSKNSITLDDDEKKNNTTPNEESSLFSSQIKKSVTMSQKKNICLSSSFFSDSDLSLSFSRRRQK